MTKLEKENFFYYAWEHERSYKFELRRFERHPTDDLDLTIQMLEDQQRVIDDMFKLFDIGKWEYNDWVYYMTIEVGKELKK